MSRPPRSISRIRLSPAHSRSSSVIILPSGAESLILSDTVGSLAADGIANYRTHETDAMSSRLVVSNEVGHKQHPVDDGTLQGSEVHAFGEDEEETRERKEMMTRPMYRRPSPWWVLGMALLASIATSSTIAPRVELYTTLACQAMKPEYAVEDYQPGVAATVPPPSRLCGKDPDVQAAVARLITIMTVSAGVLSCLTTGWWGQLSDRYGRMRILSIATIGLLATDFNLILVSHAAHRLPGGYRFLLVGPVLDGALGGMSTLQAGLIAYMSDCTTVEQRSRTFSLNTGLFFAGMACGPALGGLLIHATNDLLSVFYLATAAHVVYGFFIWFIIPESLTKSSMRNARKRRETRRSEDATISHLGSEQDGVTIRTRITSFFKPLFGFLSPLSIFIPAKRLENSGRDWNLTLLVVGFAFHGLLMGSYQFKFQYAQRTFGWDSETLGYWLSIVGVTRAAYLILILPLGIKFFKPKTPLVQLPVSPEEPLHSERSSLGSDDGPSQSLQQPPRRSSTIFDLNLARISVGAEFLCYGGMTLATSSTSWTVASILTSLGGGFTPAIQSVALALYQQGPNKGIETGRLFGGLSVVQSLSAQIIGPAVFGATYVSTVNTFPKGIFVVSWVMIACPLLSMFFVRPVREPLILGHEQEELAVTQEDE